MNFFILTLDILEEIFFYIPSGEIYKISLLCKRGRSIINNDYWIKRAAKILNKETTPEFKEFFNLINMESEIKYYRMISFGFKVEEDSMIYLPPKLCLYYAIIDNNYKIIPFYIQIIKDNNYKIVIDLCIFLRRYQCLLTILKNINMQWSELEKEHIHLKIRKQIILTFPFIKATPEKLRRKIIRLMFVQDLIANWTDSPDYLLKHYLEGKQTTIYTYCKEDISSLEKHGGVYITFNNYIIDAVEDIKELNNLEVSQNIKFRLAANWISRKGKYNIENIVDGKEYPIPYSRKLVDICLNPLFFDNLLLLVEWDGDYDKIYMEGYIGIERDKIENDSKYLDRYTYLKEKIFDSYFLGNIELHLCQCCNHYCTYINHRCHEENKY